MPQLPRIFWEIYDKNTDALNVNSFVSTTIKKVYPERYKSTEITALPIKSPFLETEMKIRVEGALKLLGEGIEGREAMVAGRYVDFLLEDGIVLELDGKMHMNTREMEMDSATEFRNMHLVLSGHRLVTINIYEYNLRRETAQLAEVIRDKLTIIREQGAVFVA